MHAALSTLERKVEEEGRAFPDRPGERQQAYALVEELDARIADTRSVLTTAISQVNAHRVNGDGAGGGGGALARVVSVLDVHLSAFQYLEQNGAKLDAALSQADRLLSQQPARASVGDGPFGSVY